MRLVDPLNIRSLSGAPLDIWNRKVRLAYLDEAGVGKVVEEPYLVIAGVILNADQHWRDVQRHIKSIRRKYLPSEVQDNFVFHAKDIWHGSGYFDRETWPRETRKNILLDLAEIPRRYGLAVVHQSVDRAAAARWLEARQRRRPRNRFGMTYAELVHPTPRPPMPPSVVATVTHLTAWVRCVQRIDLWMKANARNEVAMLVAENPGKVQRYLKWAHAGYADDEIYQPWAFTTHHISIRLLLQRRTNQSFYKSPTYARSSSNARYPANRTSRPVLSG